MTPLLHIATGQAYLWGVGGLSAVLAYRLWRDSRQGALVMLGLVWMALSCGPHHLHWGLHLLDGPTPTPLDSLTVTAALPFGALWLWWQSAAVFSERAPTLRRTGGGRPRHALRRSLAHLAGRWPAWWHTDRTIPGHSIVPPLLVLSLTSYVTATLVLHRPDRWTLHVNVQVALVVLYLIISAQWWAGQFRRRHTDGAWSAKGITLGLIWATCAMSHWSYAVALGDGDYLPDGHMLALDAIGIPAAASFITLVWWLNRHPTQRST